MSAESSTGGSKKRVADKAALDDEVADSHSDKKPRVVPLRTPQERVDKAKRMLDEAKRMLDEAEAQLKALKDSNASQEDVAAARDDFSAARAAWTAAIEAHKTAMDAASRAVESTRARVAVGAHLVEFSFTPDVRARLARP